MMSRIVTALAFLLTGIASLPELAQSADREGSSFAIVAQPVDGNTVLTARRNEAFLKFDARPATTVILQDEVPAVAAAQFGVKPDVPFTRGLQLHGLPERPGLYCDLLRSRGLGLSAACLRDIDGDGRFDQGVRLDFNSALSELLLLTPSGKIIGARFKAKPISLPTPVRYAATRPTANVTGKLALRWRDGSRRAGTAENAELWISTPGNYTGTEGISQRILSFPRARAPLDVELYGIRLHIHGFDEKGAMKVSVRGMTDGETVPLLFRGYTIVIIGY